MPFFVENFRACHKLLLRDRSQQTGKKLVDRKGHFCKWPKESFPPTAGSLRPVRRVLIQLHLGLTTARPRSDERWTFRVLFAMPAIEKPLC